MQIIKIKVILFIRIVFYKQNFKKHLDLKPFGCSIHIFIRIVFHKQNFKKDLDFKPFFSAQYS